MTTAQDIELIEIVSTPAFTGRGGRGGGRTIHTGARHIVAIITIYIDRWYWLQRFYIHSLQFDTTLALP